MTGEELLGVISVSGFFANER